MTGTVEAQQSPGSLGELGSRSLAVSHDPASHSFVLRSRCVQAATTIALHHRPTLQLIYRIIYATLLVYAGYTPADCSKQQIFYSQASLFESRGLG